MMDLVSYNEKHNKVNGEENGDGSDDNISFNCGIEGPSRKNKVSALRSKQLKNAWILNLFHQGTPMIYAGDEMCNSQMGNNNAWCQDNDISWLNWNMTKAKEDIYSFAKKMICLRKSFSMFDPSKPYRMMDVDGFGYPDFSFHGRQPWFVENGGYDRCIGCMYTGRTQEEGLKCYYFAYNMSGRSETFYLPTLPGDLVWQVLTDTSAQTGDGGPVIAPDKGYKTEDHSIVIFESRPSENATTEAVSTSVNS